MRSRPNLNDSLTGLLISAALVIVFVWVLHIIAMHAEEHGHNGPAPVFQAEPVQGAEAHARGEAEQGGGHAFFSPAGVSQRHSTRLPADE